LLFKSGFNLCCYAVVDAFTVPRFNYDTQRRVFHENTTKEPSINAEAESKIELYRERFLLLQQRILAGLHSLPGVRLVTWTIRAVTWTIPAVTWTIPAITWTIPAVMWTIPAVTWTIPARHQLVFLTTAK
jgi:hypothetical protein